MNSVLLAVTAFALFGAAHVSAEVRLSAKGLMHLHLLNNTAQSGAVCLDGTPGGFYFSPATNPANSNKWQIYFQGGGWCYDEIDCWGRSSGNLGSSKNWPKTGSLGGIVSSNCTVNPDFCSYNRVWMVYCDGNSFSGNRAEALPVRGLDGKVKNLYFRGRRIIDATLEALSLHFGMSLADTVMLTGCSAGGLATYLHTDYVHLQLKTIFAKGLKKFKAVSISGFFLQHKNVNGEPVYEDEMKNIFELANSTNGLNAKCIAAMPSSEQWKCNFAQYAYAYTESEIFPLNSALDSWQTNCIFTSELVPKFPHQASTSNGDCAAAPGWHNCSLDPEKCTADQMTKFNGYMADFQRAMEDTATFKKAGNGAFLHSCHTHCEGQNDALYTTFAVGSTTMQQAVSKWWKSGGNEPAAEHTYLPCHYKRSLPHRCNPTCGTAGNHDDSSNNFLAPFEGTEEK
jgi:hypothetical protein